MRAFTGCHWLVGAATVARAVAPGLAHGLLSSCPWTPETPHPHGGAKATAADRGAHARAGRARARGRTRSSRPPIASGAAKTMILRWYAPCSVNDEPPVGVRRDVGRSHDSGDEAIEAIRSA